jgi:hypothetical protein
MPLRRPGRARFLLLALAGVLVASVIVTLALAALVDGRPRAAPLAPSHEQPVAGSVAGPTGDASPASVVTQPPQLPPIDLATVTADELVRRVERLGWAVGPVTVSETAVGTMPEHVSVQVGRDLYGGGINLVRFESQEVTERYVGFIGRTSNAVAIQGGNNVLTVMLVHAGTRAPAVDQARALLAGVSGRPVPGPPTQGR